MPFEFFDNSLGVQNPAILVQNGLKLVPSKALTIVSGFKPWHFLYRMDLSSDKSQKGSLRNYSPAVFAVDFLTIISGVLAPRHHLMMDFNSNKSQKGSLGFFSPAAFAAEFLTIVLGVRALSHHLMMDLNNDKSPRGSLRFYFLAAFAANFLTIVSGVLAPRHHLMMDLELAKPQGKALGLTKPQSIVDFDTLDGKSRAPTWLETKPMMTTDRKLSIVTNKKDLMGWPLPSWGNKLTSFT